MLEPCPAKSKSEARKILGDPVLSAGGAQALCAIISPIGESQLCCSIAFSGARGDEQGVGTNVQSPSEGS